MNPFAISDQSDRDAADASRSWSEAEWNSEHCWRCGRLLDDCDCDTRD